LKVFIDACLFIYLNTLSDGEASAPYELFYESLLSKFKASVYALVPDEVIYVSWRKYGVPYAASIDSIESAVLPYVSLLGLGEAEYGLAVEVLRRHGTKLSDALHVGAVEDNGVELVA